MAKDINIHVKTQGAEQVSQELDKVAASTKNVGDTIEGMGSNVSRSSDILTSAFGKITAALSFTAIIAGIGMAASKISDFFGSIKSRCDESIESLENLYKGFQKVFDAMNAFDKKTQKDVVKASMDILKETKTSTDPGLSIIAGYARQHKDLMDSGRWTQAQYDQGLKGMLLYSNIHGHEATPELIQVMSGEGLKTPEEEGEFRRELHAAAEKAKLEDKDMINVYGRVRSTTKAMGWSALRTMAAASSLSEGEKGRQQLSIPIETITALGNPNAPNPENWGIKGETAKSVFEKHWKELARNPELFRQSADKFTKNMTPQDRYRFYNEVYGTGGVGYQKLANLSARESDILDMGGQVGIEKENAENKAYSDTILANKTLLELNDLGDVQNIKDQQYFENLLRREGKTYNKGRILI